MVRRSEPLGSKPFLPGLVKVTMAHQTTLTPSASASCVLHGRWADSVNHPQGELNDQCTSWRGAWEAGVITLLGNHWALLNVTVQSLGGDGLEAVQASTQVGGSGATAFPPQVACCVSFTTGITARGGRGRVYIPGIPSNATNSVDSQELTTAFATSMQTGVFNFLSTVAAHLTGGVACEPVVPSYYHQYQLRSVPAVFPIFGTKVHRRLASQRRRSGKERLYPVV